MLNVCNMLYVNDVIKVADFWKSIGFVELNRTGSGKEETVILAPSQDSNAKLQFWNLDFIREVSPEVADGKPSLLFTVDDLEGWHKKVAKVTDKVSPINNHQGMINFNFPDPEGNYYAFSESELPSGQ